MKMTIVSTAIELTKNAIPKTIISFCAFLTSGGTSIAMRASSRNSDRNFCTGINTVTQGIFVILKSLVNYDLMHHSVALPLEDLF